MKSGFYISFFLLLAALFFGAGENALFAQDTVSEREEISLSVAYADEYLKHRTASLKKFIGQNHRIQERLLKKISHLEQGLSGLPGEQDSLWDMPYQRNTVDFDSLQRLTANPSQLYNKGSPKTKQLIDSLKGIHQFLQQQSSRLQQTANITTPSAGITGNYSAKLQELQQQLSAQEQLQKLIAQRTQALQQQFSGKNIPVLNKITKQIAIAQSKGQSWRQMANEPDVAEERAYEYLQGIKGFNNYLNTDDKAFGGLGNNATAEDLQRMGYQTKGMVGKALQEQFGAQLDNVQKQMGEQLAAYREEINKVADKAKEAQFLYADTKNQAIALRNAAKIEKPSFKNPMRGLPFLLRWQTRYDFQTTRAMNQRPAMLNFSAGLAYKQTPRLKIGAGIAADIGMGKDWQHLKLSYEGTSLRAFVDYEVIFGISVEGGYERTFRPAGRPYLDDYAGKQSETEGSRDMVKKAFGSGQQAAYLGVMKSYRINSKWNGTFMLGYNFLWQQYGLRTPLMVRIGWEK